MEIWRKFRGKSDNQHMGDKSSDNMREREDSVSTDDNQKKGKDEKTVNNKKNKRPARTGKFYDNEKSQKQYKEKVFTQNDYDKLKKQFEEISESIKELNDKIDRISKQSNKNSFEEISNLLNNSLGAITKEQPAILEKIGNNGKVLKDLKNTHDAYLKSINTISSKVSQNIESKMKNDNNSICNNIDNKANEILSKLKNIDNEPIISPLEDVTRDLKDVKNNIETIVGTQKNTQEQVTKLQDVLGDKNLDIKRKLPATTHDETTIVQLGEYGKTIFDQILTAARWYARQKEEFAQATKKGEDVAKQCEEKYAKGIEEGKKQEKDSWIVNLLKKYDDVDKLMTTQDPQLKVLAEFLRNEGVKPIYPVGAVVSVTEQNLQSSEITIEGVQVGKFKITKSGYSFGQTILQRAACEPEREEEV